MKRVLPVLVLAVLAIGGAAGVMELQNGNTRVQVAAEQKLGEVSGMVFAQGEMVVSFAYPDKLAGGVQVYLADEAKWVPVTVVAAGQDRYQISFGKMLPTNSEVRIRVNGEEAVVPIRIVKP